METQEHENKPAIGPRSLKKTDPRERQTGKLEIYAYSVKDPAFGEFFILNTANAWWSEKAKVVKLIDAYKLHCNDREARFYVGITEKQLRYFNELHPDFWQIKELCMQNLALHARQSVAKQIQSGDPEAGWRWLSKVNKDEFAGRVQLSNPDGSPLQNQNAIVFVDFSETVTTEPYEEPKAEESNQLPEHAESQ